MTPRPSRLLRELRAGLNPCTLKFNLNDPRIIEMAGLSGASAVWLCNELGGAMRDAQVNVSLLFTVAAAGLLGCAVLLMGVKPNAPRIASANTLS